MTESVYDLAIVGGGINGAGIAADAAGRGLKVLLAEMGDLAGATSSASSKLIHGGLRYLEHYEFRLVREALEEREVLLGRAPHIIRPLRFVLPHVPGMRPRALIHAGLTLYDHLAKRRRIPASSALDLARDPAGRALRPELTHGFAYWDCWVDDARLVVLNARAAADRGATILTRTRVSGLRGANGLWHIALAAGNDTLGVSARALVNAAGPWVDAVAGLAREGGAGAKVPHLKLVKGSHIVVPRIAGAEDAYLLQSGDGRVVFALPFEGRFTLIGTTDIPFSGDPAGAAISPPEEDYLIALAGRFFAAPLARGDIVWRYSGVRPLSDDGDSNPSAISRDYRLELAMGPAAAPFLNVIGGKITTHRRLAEAALAKLAPHLPPMGPAWTATAPLPGGGTGGADDSVGFEGYRLDLARRRPQLSAELLGGLVRRYGTETDRVLGEAKEARDLGADLGGGLTEREVVYLKDHEWAREPDDVLWRRTKAGLHMTAEQRSRAADRIARLL
jgi:glycerol-3-phosphate dehydrogenase